MKILIFTDQHPQSLGGVQNSVLLQAKYLHKRGHTVTIVSPSLAFHSSDTSHPRIICYKSIPLPGNYTAGVVSKAVLEHIYNDIKAQDSFDVVHIQGDFWGAIVGVHLAKKLNLPIVHTLHNNVSYGLKKAVGGLATSLFTLYLCSSYRRFVDKTMPITPSPQVYLAHLVKRAAAIIVPTDHFYRQLLTQNILDETSEVTIMPTGIDDDSLKYFNGAHKTNSIIWSGRLSNEKRILFFLKAIRHSKIANPIHIYGNGPMRRKAERYVRYHQMQSVIFKGAVSHNDMLKAISESQLLVQTSIDFETQGMTVYEAVSLGTHVLVCDSNIAKDLNSTMVHFAHSDSVEILAREITTAAESLYNNRKKGLKKSDNDSDYRQSKLILKQEGVYMAITDKSVR